MWNLPWEPQCNKKACSLSFNLLHNFILYSLIQQVNFLKSCCRGFWPHDPFTCLPSIEDPREFLSMWVVAIGFYHIRNRSWEFFEILVCVKRAITNPLHVTTRGWQHHCQVCVSSLVIGVGTQQGDSGTVPLSPVPCNCWKTPLYMLREWEWKRQMTP